jgi:hypothetical protein
MAINSASVSSGVGIGAGTVVSAAAEEIGAPPAVAHVAGAVADIVSQNYLSAVGNIAAAVGHLTGILGGSNEIKLTLTGEQQGDFWAGRQVILTDEQILKIKPRLNPDDLQIWGDNMVKLGIRTPDQVTALLGVVPGQPQPPVAQQTNVFGIEVKAPQDPMATFWTGQPSAAMPAAAPPPQDELVNRFLADGHSMESAVAGAAAQRAEQDMINQLVAQGHTPHGAVAVLVAQNEAARLQYEADIAAQQASIAGYGA